jgi:hypothetical protein
MTNKRHNGCLILEDLQMKKPPREINKTNENVCRVLFTWAFLMILMI